MSFCRASAAIGDAPELPGVEKTVHPSKATRGGGHDLLRRSRNRQPLATLRTPATQNRPSATGLHSSPKSMNSASTNPARLVSAFHRVPSASPLRTGESSCTSNHPPIYDFSRTPGRFLYPRGKIPLGSEIGCIQVLPTIPQVFRTDR